MQKHTQHNNEDERTQFFRKIYLSLYWKGCVWEVSWRPNKDCNILTPTLLAITAFLSRSPGLLNWGPRGQPLLGHASHSSIFSPTDLNSNCSIEGPAGPLCWMLVLSTASYLQLTWTSCAPSYIIVLHPLNSIRRQSRLSSDILDWMHQVISLFYPYSIQPINSQGYLLTSLTGCTCYLHKRISYFDSLARSEVNIEHHLFNPFFQMFYCHGDIGKAQNSPSPHNHCHASYWCCVVVGSQKVFQPSQLELYNTLTASL